MTEIADRIREAAANVGGLNKLAALVGIPRRTLGDKLSGRSALELALVVNIAAVTGVRLEWLAADEGPRDMPDQDRVAVRPADTTEVALAVVEIMKLSDLTMRRIFEEEGVRIPDVQRVAELAEHVAAVVSKMDDPTDLEEFRSLIPWLEGRIRKNLAAPGTGKREAS